MGLFGSALRLALVAILRNKLRAALTVLGVLIGVAAVVVVVALAAGASSEVGSQIDSFASNALYVFPEAVQRSGARDLDRAQVRLTEGDGRAILREAVSVTDVAPFLSTSTQVVFGDQNVSTLVAGVTLPYFRVRRFALADGALWTESDELTKTKVCVLGRTVATALFGASDPVGQTIRIGSHPHRVLGVLVPKGTSPYGEDQDDRILMPIGSVRARIRPTPPGRVDMLLASASSEHTTARAEEQITAILRQRHRLADSDLADFGIRTQKEYRETQKGIADVLQALLLGVAAVSLVVGGIGVMNIMLVSVAERTREIGIRLSIGARERDILLQFLIEAVALSSMGGALGIALGSGLTFAAARALDWKAAPTADAILVAVATSALIGVVFGFVPARRAAKLDPIEALRSE
jgi:putative ABC transport system permease protein